LLASYMKNKSNNEKLEEYLSHNVFSERTGTTVSPVPKDVEGFEHFMKRYTNGLAIEKAAIANLE